MAGKGPSSVAEFGVSVRGRRSRHVRRAAVLLCDARCLRLQRPKPESTPTLNWYVGPDRVDAARAGANVHGSRRRLRDRGQAAADRRRRAPRDARTPAGGQGHLDRRAEPRLGVHRRVRRGTVPRAGARGLGRPTARTSPPPRWPPRHTTARSRSRRGGSTRSCSGTAATSPNAPASTPRSRSAGTS